MNTQRQAFLLVGSLKGPKSTSDFLGAYLLNMLRGKGFKTEKMYINSLFESANKRDKFLACLDDSEVVIFSSPLYIDCEPYLLIKSMETILEHRKNNKGIKKPRLLVISNGGYPEAQHNDTVIPIYRNFAIESGFEWMGGLALGMGAAISVPILRKADLILGNVKKSLEITAEAISDCKPIPNRAIDLMSRPLVPVWFYSFVARSIARFFSITNRAWNIYNRPY